MTSYYIVAPIFLIAVLEALYCCYKEQSKFSFKTVFSALGMLFGGKFFYFFNAVATSSIFFACYESRIFTFDQEHWLTFIASLIVVDFVMYWSHRISHQVPWMWASHVVHHTPQKYTLLMAYRMPWTELISLNWMLYLPLALLGFSPLTIGLSAGLNRVFQFLLHTRHVPKLGFLEVVFNTPSHHHLHHASNPQYANKNLGGILIVWDKMFGTFVVEDPNVVPVYGLKKQLDSENPIRIAFHGWFELFKNYQSAWSKTSVLKSSRLLWKSTMR